jgi:hypothetical protein
MGGIFIIAWSLSISDSQGKSRSYQILLFVFGIVSFVVGRAFDQFVFEILGLIISMSTIIFVVVKMFTFAFRKSPYVKARQRVFAMMVGFIGFSIFEAAGVAAFGQGEYYLSAILFILELPFRLIIALSILLPRQFSDLLSKFIH